MDPHLLEMSPHSDLLESVLDSNVDDKPVGTLMVRKDTYNELMKIGNLLSYSMEQNLISCPRKYKLKKLRSDCETLVVERETNADFAFGHSVGAGVAEYDRTGDLSKAILAAFFSWNIDLLAESPKKEYKDPKKSFAHAVWALKLYESFYLEEGLGDYTVERIEATIGVDLEDGYFYTGHIDELLKHKETGNLRIKENKTTVFDSVDPALYANSDQALSYTVAVEAYGKTEYDVFYCVYSSTSQRWIRMDFTKTVLQKAEWLQGQLLLSGELEQYSVMNFFPKRGKSCLEFNRRCEFFEGCDSNSDKIFRKKFSDLRKIESLEELETIEPLDFKVKLSDLITGQEQGLLDSSDFEQENQAAFGTNTVTPKTGMETL